MSERPRVLIVGAGPTGLTMAHELAGDGISCRVIDKAPHRAMESRAIAIHSRTVETFDLMGPADDFLEAGHRIAGVSIYGESGRIAAEGGPGAADRPRRRRRLALRFDSGSLSDTPGWVCRFPLPHGAALRSSRPIFGQLVRPAQRRLTPPLF